MFRMRGYNQTSGQQPQQYGWKSTSHDYINHLQQIMSTTSTLTDVPQYPSVHSVFKAKAVPPAEQFSIPKNAKKHVHVAEQEKTIIRDNPGNYGTVGKLIEESIVTDADSVIQQRRQGFELCKWNTFKKAT